MSRFYFCPIFSALFVAVTALADEKAAVVKLLDAAASGATHEQLVADAKAVADSTLREKLTAFLPELEKAAETHRRIEELIKMAEEVKGSAQTEPGGPEWLRAVAGDDAMKLFAKLTVLDFHNAALGPHDKAQHTDHDVTGWIERLHDLPDLASLTFTNSNVEDQHIAALGALPKLHSLNIALCKETDAAIPMLKKFRALWHLSIGANKNIAGHGFDQLGSLTQLEVINLHACMIDDEGLRQIATLPAIKQLELGHGAYTDKGIETLSTITRLRRIQVAAKGVTPAGLKPLSNLVNLEELFIYDNLATDESIPFVLHLPDLWFLSLVGPYTEACIPGLSTMKQLKTLELGNKAFPDSALTALQAALPNTEVKRK